MMKAYLIDFVCKNPEVIYISIKVRFCLMHYLMPIWRIVYIYIFFKANLATSKMQAEGLGLTPEP